MPDPTRQLGIVGNAVETHVQKPLKRLAGEVHLAGVSFLEEMLVR